MTNIVQIKNQQNPYEHLFYGLVLQKETFQQVRTNLAYLFYLRSLFHEDQGYEMLEDEILTLYQTLFTNDVIIEPFSTQLTQNSLMLSFVSAEHSVLSISNQELKSFIVQKKNAENDFYTIKAFILDDLKNRHPWASLRPNTSSQDWEAEKQRLHDLAFKLTPSASR